MSGLLCCAIAHAYSVNDIIATYAGNGTAGFSGDGGPAVAAELTQPDFYMAFDAAGNLYVSNANAVRKVSTAGIITTVAGTGASGNNGNNIPAIAAQLSASGIAFDPAGDLYLADPSNNVIRKVTLSTGIISVFAGTGGNGCGNGAAGSATFNAPTGLTFVGSDLYVSDLNNGVIRKISGGTVSTFAGTCAAPVLNSPMGLANDGSNVYVADASANAVFKFDMLGAKTLFAGNSNGTPGYSGDGSSATAANVALDAPFTVARDSTGNVFIGDSANHVVRVVTTDNVIHTAAGNGTAGNTGDGGLATGAELNVAAGVAVNAAGILFIADSSATPVIRIVGPAAPLIVGIGGHTAADDIVVSADGRIACAQCGANYVQGMPVILSSASTALNNARGGMIYQWSGGRCQNSETCAVIPASAAPTTVIAYFSPRYINTLVGGPASNALAHPFSLAADNNGNLYMSDTGTCEVLKHAANGTVSIVAGIGICGDIGDGMAATAAELNNPQGLAIDSLGNLFIQDSGNSKIRKVTLDGIFHTFATGVASGASPALAIDAAENVYSYGSGNVVLRIASNGTAQTFATLAATDTPNGLVAKAGANGLTLSVIRDTQAAGFSRYQALFLDVSQAGVISLNPEPETFFNSTPFTAQIGMAYDSGARLYYSAEQICSVVDISKPASNVVIAGSFPTCAFGGDGGPAIAADLNNPLGMVFAGNNRLYIADSANKAVRVAYSDSLFTGDFNH